MSLLRMLPTGTKRPSVTRTTILYRPSARSRAALLGDGPVLPMAAPLVLSKDLPTPQFAERLYGQRKETKGGSKGGSTETSPPPFRPPPMEERPTPQIHPLGHIPDYLRQRKEELEASPAMHRKQASDEPAKQTHQLGHIPGYIRRRRSNAGMMEEEAKRAAAEASQAVVHATRRAPRIHQDYR